MKNAPSSYCEPRSIITSFQQENNNPYWINSLFLSLESKLLFSQHSSITQNKPFDMKPEIGSKLKCFFPPFFVELPWHFVRREQQTQTSADLITTWGLFTDHSSKTSLWKEQMLFIRGWHLKSFNSVPCSGNLSKTVNIEDFLGLYWTGNSR